MKKSVLFLFAAVVITGAISLLSSCGKEVTITYNIADRELCLPALPFSGAGVTDTFLIQQADLQAAFTAASTTYSTGRITKLAAKGFKLKVTGSGAANFDKILGAQVYVKALGTSGDGRQIASIDNAIAAGTSEITMNVSGVDLKDLLGSQPLVLTIRVYNADASPAVCVKLTEGTMNFELKK